MNSTQKTLQNILKTFPISIQSKSQAKQLHAQIIKTTKTPNSPALTSTILSIYSNINLLHDSVLVFNTLHSPPTYAWKSIIKCYTCNGFFAESLVSFIKMRESGCYPDHNVFPSVLKSCSHLMDFKFGESVHGCIIRLGSEADLFTGNALMNMYSRLRVSKVFDKSPESSHINEIGSEAFRENQNVDNVTKVFEMMPRRDVVSWNTLIAGNVQNGMYKEALVRVREMAHANLKPDPFTLSSVLPIFAEYVDVMKGKEIHGYAIRCGLDGDMYIGSSLVDMYANCRRMDDSFRVFSSLPYQDDVSWNSVIAGFIQNGFFDEGLKLFRQMLQAKVELLPRFFSTIIPACAHLTTLLLGKQLHGCIIRSYFDDNLYISSALVDMYAKCGNIRAARWIFDKMELHDIVSWTAMIMGCASHGHVHDALSLFEQMAIEGVRPNYVAFVAVLTACCHAGKVNEAWKYFSSMVNDYQIAPGLEHYTCMADLLGRAGKLKEAYEFISTMQIEPTASIWSTLLAACRVHKNVHLAEEVAQNMFKIEMEDTSSYVLLANTYSAAGRYEEAAKLRIHMNEKGMRKEPACSWIEVGNRVHAFGTRDKSHPYYDRMVEALKALLEQMEREGYVLDARVVLHDIEEV